jgi:RNA polymerase sigma factor (sigma-70 family)
LSDKPLHSIEFVKAVQENDRKVIEEYSAYVVPKIIEYLMVTLKANKFHAEECSHHAFSVVLNRVTSNSLDESTSILAYMITTARNEYFRMIKNESREGGAVFQEQLFLEAEEQLDLLIDQDKERILQSCLKSLDSKSRDFIEFLLRHPDYSLLKVGKVFNISPENARTRKSRIIASLSECIKRKNQ